jgi:hypothetical protein
MTKTDFMAICSEHLIDVEIALENHRVRCALKLRCTEKEIKQVLTKEF